MLVALLAAIFGDHRIKGLREVNETQVSETIFCPASLQGTSLVLDINFIVIWYLSKHRVGRPTSQDHIADSNFEKSETSKDWILETLPT